MKSQHVLPLRPPSFALLVKYLKNHIEECEVIEIDLDSMRVKGDLRVIQDYFKKPMIAKSQDLDMLRKGVKAGMTYADVPHNMEMDLEFITLVKNKECQLIRSYHNFEETPSTDELNKIIAQMEGQRLKPQNPELIKIATQVHSAEDAERLLQLLENPKTKERLIICGMGENEAAKNMRIQAPQKGSVFYYAPLDPKLATAAGQLTKAELDAAFKRL